MPFLKSSKLLESRCRDLENLAKKNGLRHSIYTPLKDKYVGEWRNNIKEGKGSLVTRSGHLYEGDFERNYRHGFGVLALKNINAVNDLEYRGEWQNGRMHGFGCRHYPDGSFYRGNWKSGKRHGYGQMWYKDGSFYDGMWVKDMREGEGMFVRSDGNRYEGNWKKDMKHGKGRFFHLDSGQMQEGVWQYDNCSYSCVTDIPFRQNAVESTPYPIHPIQLSEFEKICENREQQLLGGMYSTCLSFATFHSYIVL